MAPMDHITTRLLVNINSSSSNSSNNSSSLPLPVSHKVQRYHWMVASTTSTSTLKPSNWSRFSQHRDSR